MTNAFRYLLLCWHNQPSEIKIFFSTINLGKHTDQPYFLSFPLWKVSCSIAHAVATPSCEGADPDLDRCFLLWLLSVETSDYSKRVVKQSTLLFDCFIRIAHYNLHDCSNKVFRF